MNENKYPTFIIYNKTASDIENYIMNLAGERQIPIEVLLFIIGKVTANIQNAEIDILNNKIINLINDSSTHPTPKEDKKEEK